MYPYDAQDSRTSTGSFVFNSYPGFNGTDHIVGMPLNPNVPQGYAQSVKTFICPSDPTPDNFGFVTPAHPNFEGKKFGASSYCGNTVVFTLCDALGFKRSGKGTTRKRFTGIFASRRRSRRGRRTRFCLPRSMPAARTTTWMNTASASLCRRRTRAAAGGRIAMSTTAMAPARRCRRGSARCSRGSPFLSCR